MAIILENIKNRSNVIKKQQYRYLDYNDLAIGQVGILLIDFLNEKSNSGEISPSINKQILNLLNLKNNYSNKISDKNVLKDCLVNIESDLIEYKYIDEDKLKINLINPKEKLSYLYDVADSIKLFYNKTDNKKIYPDILAKEIFSVYDLMSQSIDDLLEFDSFVSSKNNSFEEEFLNYLEENLIYTTINSESPKYDINNIKLNSTNYNLNINELKHLAPILINGNSLVWNKNKEVSMSSSILDINNVDIDQTIKYLYNQSSIETFKDIHTYTYQYLNDKINFDQNFNNNQTNIKVFILKSLLEIDSLGEFLLNNNKTNSYKNSIYDQFVKLNKILSLNNTNIDTNDKINSIFNNIQSVMNKFRNENSSISININSKNEKKAFSFESNYYQIKTILKSYSKQNGLSMLLPGPPDFGKSHSTEELIDLFGGLIIKQEHILSLSALVGTFEKRPANFDSSKRTHPITELKTSVINGEYGNGIIHMEEGARTFMELLTSKVNSPDESALLSILEPMSRPNKFWKVDAYGQNLKLFPAEHIKFVWSTNFIPKNLSNELQVRFTSIPMDFSTITNYKSLESITNNMLYKVNIEREINNFSNEDNSIKFINIIQQINSKTKDVFQTYNLDPIFEIYKNSNKNYDIYSSKLSDDNKKDIVKFQIDNRIDPFILFILKDEINILHSNIKEYINIIGNNDISHLNDSMKYARLKNMVSNINKDFKLDIDFNQSFKQYGLSLDLITKPLDELSISINDLLQRYHTLDSYFMTIINQFQYLSDIKLDLINSKSIVNNYSDILLTVGQYIKDKIDINYINEKSDVSNSEIYQFLSIKENYLKLASTYNSLVFDDYKKIVNSYNNQYSILPFKSSDAPIIGFEKIFKSINELSKSKGIINEELLKTMTSGIDLQKFNTLLDSNSVFTKSYINDIGLGGTK